MNGTFYLYSNLLPQNFPVSHEHFWYSHFIQLCIIIGIRKILHSIWKVPFSISKWRTKHVCFIVLNILVVEPPHTTLTRFNIKCVKRGCCCLFVFFCLSKFKILMNPMKVSFKFSYWSAFCYLFHRYSKNFVI